MKISVPLAVNTYIPSPWLGRRELWCRHSGSLRLGQSSQHKLMLLEQLAPVSRAELLRGGTTRAGRGQFQGSHGTQQAVLAKNTGRKAVGCRSCSARHQGDQPGVDPKVGPASPGDLQAPPEQSICAARSCRACSCCSPSWHLTSHRQ